MVQNILAMGFMLGFFCMMFVTPCIFARGIFKIEYDVLATSDKVISLVPILNVIKAEKLYTGKFSKTGLAAILLVVTFIVRLIIVFTLPSVYTAQLITIVLFILSIILVYVANVYIVFLVLNDADTMGLFGKIVFSAIFPLGQYYIGTYLPTVMKHFSKEEDTFK